MIELVAAFDWFAKEPPRSGTSYKRIPKDLGALWAEVRDSVGRERFDASLGGTRAGERFGKDDDHAWVQTHAERDESSVNLTLEIDADELNLNLVGYFDGQLEKIRGWLDRRSGRAFLRLHPQLEVVVFVRTGQRGKNGRVMWKGAGSKEHGRIGTAEVGGLSIRLSTLARQIDPETQKLALHVRKRWSRERVEGMNDVTEIAALVEDWIEELPTVQLGGEPRQW